MKRTWLIILLVVSISAMGGIAALYLFSGSAKERRREKIEILSRNMKRTVLKQVSLVRSFELPVSFSTMRFYDHRLYVQDYASQEIWEVDTFGNVLNKYFRRGSGPGEFQSSRSFGIEDNLIYGVDVSNLCITERQMGDTLFRTYKLNEAIDGGIRLGSATYLVTTRGEQIGFMFVDIARDVKKVLASPFPIVKHSTMVFDGFYVDGVGGQGFYVCYMTGKFVSFDSTGKILYARETIDRAPYPEIKEFTFAGEQARMPSDDSPQVVRAASADSASLYVLSGICEVDLLRKHVSLVDLYDAATGEYRSSFPIPPHKGAYAVSIAIAPNGIYVYQGESIVYYHWAK